MTGLRNSYSGNETARPSGGIMQPGARAAIFISGVGMSDTFTVTTRKSWFSRIGNSIGGVVVGLVLILVGVVVLFWNEGRAVQTALSLAEGKGLVVSVPATAVDAANDGKLIHTSGPVTTTETLADSTFGITATGVRLHRKAEMYQWVEKSETKTETKVGGGEESVTTYTYTREWVDHAVDSGAFKQPDGHRNPAMTYQGQQQQIGKGMLGAFTLDTPVLDLISGSEALPVAADKLDAVKAAAGQTPRPLSITDGKIYMGFNAGSPSVGDQRISYELTPLSDISVVGKQAGSGFTAYQTIAGDSLLMVDRGNVTAEKMFADAESANTVLTWILRVVGIVMLMIAFALIMAPLGVIGDVIPFVGRIVRMGTGLVAFALAVLVGSVTIAVAWFWYRPVLSLIIIGVGVAITAVVLYLGRNRKAASPAAPAGPASATPA